MDISDEQRRAESAANQRFKRKRAERRGAESPKTRATKQKAREEKLEQIRQAIAEGRLTIRVASADERARWARDAAERGLSAEPSPREAAAAAHPKIRRAVRAGKLTVRQAQPDELERWRRERDGEDATDEAVIV